MKLTKEDKLQLGERIKQIRLKKGMTTKEFGSLLGATDSNITSWEKGRTSPNPERLKMISKIADITVEELLHGNFQRYYFNKYWKKLVENKTIKSNFNDMSIKEFEYLEAKKEQIFDKFLHSSIELGYNTKNMLENNAEGLLEIAIIFFLSDSYSSEVEILNHFIFSLEELKKKLEKNYQAIFDKSNQFNKETYDKVMNITDRYIANVGELYNLTRERYQHNE